MAAGLLISSIVSKPAEAISLPKRMADGLSCRVLLTLPHMHQGRSGYVLDMPTAQARAIVAWQRFTAWEYGKKWADVALARRQRFTCRPDRRLNWNCTFYAQPCRW